MNDVFLGIILAGGAGAATRFVFDGFIRNQLGRKFPWGTFIINVSGSCLLGVLIGIVLRSQSFTNLYMVLGFGFCSGYTTFSSASYEALRLIETKQLRLACMNIFGSLALSSIGAAAGMMISFL